MISHTKSFAILKQQAQRTFDFAIVVTYAVPALKFALKNLDPNTTIPFKADHFDSRPVATAKVLYRTKEYKAALSSHIFLSSFSFFEAYFHDILKEIVDFHGAPELLGKTSITKNHVLSDPESIKQKRKLQEYYTPGNQDRYVSNGKKLHNKGYRFPSTLLSGFGLQKLIELAQGDYIRAAEIPILALSVLQIDIDQKTEVDIFQGYRSVRNRIAHGRAGTRDLHLKKAIEANNFLRNLALKIDNHVVENFLVTERF
jgi:RiboL-PSP-HEPN